MVSWMEGELARLVWKKGTLAAIVGNIEDGILDVRRVGRLVMEEEGLGSNIW